MRATSKHGGPTVSDYIGVYQFGTETSHTLHAENVTFTAQSVLMDIGKGIASVENGVRKYATRRILTIVPVLLCLIHFWL